MERYRQIMIKCQNVKKIKLNDFLKFNLINLFKVTIQVNINCSRIFETVEGIAAC